jgi:hypothetical protein
VRARIENRADASRAVHASYQGRSQYAVFRFSGSEIGEGGSESVVRRCESEEHAERHCLAVVELGVGWPAWVVDVGFVPVGDEGAGCVGEVA